MPPFTLECVDCPRTGSRRDICFDIGMARGLIQWSLVTLIIVTGATALSHARAAGSANGAGGNQAVLQRFLALDDPAPTEYRALRHLDASNDKFEKSAWMDVWTEAGRSGGFRYRIVAEGGSEYIRSRLFVASLEAERNMWASGAPDQATVTAANYEFEDRGERADGLASLTVKPRRKDLLLIEGSIFLRPHDGELMRMEGRLTKSPSFWTRHVEIVRWYGRFAGVRMPVALESVAHLLVAGRSTFRMSYEYETVNGQRVGTPVPRTLVASAAPNR